MRTAILAILLVMATTGCSLVPFHIPQSGSIRREGLDPRMNTTIDEFRATVSKAMRENNVPGCAIALVDEQGILWSEGFGYIDRAQHIPVTPDTPFLTCSISKTLTATVVMLAVQEGLLDLDAPVTTYLPDLWVNSRYEEHAEQKITLRNLLSHTAGLPLDPPIGNILEVEGSFENHVQSVYGTWLIYPVGQATRYSNIGVDLAAYALQTAAQLPFSQYVEEQLFVPLGMSNSMLDPVQILDRDDRATGHTTGFADIPAVVPEVGAGGIYCSAVDLASFIQFFLNQGSLNGRRLLDDSLMNVMTMPHSYSRKAHVYNGLGIGVAQSDDDKDRYLVHRGIGYGFETFIKWYPAYGIGVVILANRMPAAEVANLSIVERLLAHGDIQARQPTCPVDARGCIAYWTQWPGHSPSPFQKAWKDYCGVYVLAFGGYEFEWWAKLGQALLSPGKYIPKIRVYEQAGRLKVTESRFFSDMLKSLWQRQVSQDLEEIKPGLFYTASGGVLDFRGTKPTWCNYRLNKR
jgi:CubicO group peptidase (beta-lactamase class C family)